MQATDLYDDSLCCKLCGDTYKQPLILVCGHSLCTTCAETSFTYQNFKGKNLPPTKNVVHSIEKKANVNDIQILCPTCSKPTFIPENKKVTEILKINYDLRDIIEKMQQGNKIPCGLECGNIAEIDCSNCSVSLCNICFDSMHQKGVYKTHKKLPLGESKKKIMTCTKHGKELELYCKNCRIEVCFMCSGFGEHKGHDSVLLIDFAASCKKEIENGSVQLKNSASSIAKSKIQVQQEIEKVNMSHDSFITELQKSCDELRQLIDQKQKELSQKSQEIRDQKLSKLKEQLLNISELNSKMENLLESFSDPAKFIHPLDITNHFKGIQKALTTFHFGELAPALLPCVNSQVNFTISNDSAKKAISTIATIRDTEDVKHLPLGLPSSPLPKKEFKLQYPGDKNGLIYWLGTSRGTSNKWKNPADIGIVRVQRTNEGGGKLSDALMREPPADINSRAGDSGIAGWYIIDISPLKMNPTNIIIRHDGEAGYYVRSWSVMGSDDGENWTTLEDIKNDNSITAPLHYSKCEITTKYSFSFFQLESIEDSSKSSEFHLVSFDIYGKIE